MLCLNPQNRVGKLIFRRKTTTRRNNVKKNLEESEKILKKALEKNRACENCIETLGSVYVIQAYMGFSKNYDDALKLLNSAQAAYPQSPKIAYALGYAQYYSSDFRGAIKSLDNFLALSHGDPARETYAQQLIQASQKNFLTYWNDQANFYSSPESRIEIYNPQTYRMEVAYQVTPEWENQTGAFAVNQLGSQGPEYNDPELNSYLTQLIQRMVQSTPGPPYNYQVHVIDTPVVNAITVPGYVIVNTGLIRFVNNESELVAVLGHELGHNYGHHAARRVIKAYHAQVVTNAIISAVNPQSQTSQLIASIAGTIGLGLFLNAYNRFEESEADRYGAHISYNAGYSPTSMSTFLLHMYEANPKQPIKFLSTHPPLPKRIEELTEYIESFPLNKEMRADSQAFQNIKAKIGSFEKPGQNLPPVP